MNRRGRIGRGEGAGRTVELDPAFGQLTAWDYRMAVNGDEPDETLAWGRQMLRNDRPDHIATADYRWRHVARSGAYADAGPLKRRVDSVDAIYSLFGAS